MGPRFFKRSAERSQTSSPWVSLHPGPLDSLDTVVHPNRITDSNTCQSSDANPTLTFPYTPQSMEQSYPYQFDYQDTYLTDHVNPFHSAPEGQDSHPSAVQPSQGYPETFSTAQAFHHPQTTPLESPSHYTTASLHDSQSFNALQGLESANTPSNFPLGTAYDPHHSFENAFGQAHTQQTQWNYPASDLNPSLPGPPSTPWVATHESLDDFNFNSPLTGQNVGPMYGQHPLNVGAPSRTDFVYRPASRGQLTPSRPLVSATNTPSPRSDLASIVPQEHGVHKCHWQLDGDKICEKQFKDIRGLFDHIAETHVETSQANGQDGFMCCWAGCPRQTDEKCERKRGFTARSKLKRHITIHTGPSKYLTSLLHSRECIFRM